MPPEERFAFNRAAQIPQQTKMLKQFLFQRSFLAVIAIFVANRSFAQPASPMVIGPGQSVPGLDSGELLLGELNCVACHKVETTVKTRLNPRIAPKLGSAGLSVTPQFLRAFISNPQTEKPGTTMPDVLQGLSDAERGQTVDALVHYLVSAGKGIDGAPTGADSIKIHKGRALYHQVGCVACHGPQESAASLKTSSEGAMFINSTNQFVPLGNLALKTTVGHLARFLMDPLKIRPSGRMPSLNLTEMEANSIAMYLLRAQAAQPGGKNQRMSGLSYEYYEGSFSSAAKLDAKKLKESGTIENFQLTPKKRTENIGFQFAGYIKIPRDGSYTFYTSSDDGSRLMLDSKLVVDNDGTHAPQEKKGTIDLETGDHLLQVTYFNGGAGAELRVSVEGPGMKKQEVPSSLLSTDKGIPMEPLKPENLVVDAAKAAQGKVLFANLGCASCHQVGNEKFEQLPSAKALAALNPSAGCLASAPGKGTAKYQLSDTQRASLQKVLANSAQLAQVRSAKEQAAHTMAALNCFACHSRDGVGGPSAATAEYFATAGEADLGDEGRIPPHLNQVGGKLRPEWIREVLTRKGTARPYMATRMPQFGDANVGFLAATFEKTDSNGAGDSEADLRDLKYGRKLVGTEGLACISCHTFAEHKSLGIPAMDLTVMTKRLKQDWFHRYLLDPQSLRPGTRMPTFWPEGKSARKDILSGETDRQIDAIWAYLGKAREAGLPPGLVQGKMEIVADSEAIIYRNFIDGAGPRAIGVGYPEKANLAFDANELRLAMIWQGPFIDAARHRTGRGEGFEKPLGYNVIKMPPGASFAILEDQNAKWPDATTKTAGSRMAGYQLDQKQRPAFHYTCSGVDIEDYPVAVSGDTDPSIRRTITLRVKQPVEKLWFRAWAGSKVEEQPDGTYLADGRVRFKLQSAAKPVIRRNGDSAELLVPVQFNGAEAKLVEEIIW
ncbi:MAG: cytochrome c1 [Verrucomicrobiales bacterium]|nr:cytochrome c1 [Verrucomicrobiales bacterium]